MARIIEFHIPDTYQPKARPIPVTRGKVIEFPASQTKQSA
jgi:hypothetical protein